MSIACNTTEDITGEDEICLTVKGTKVWGLVDMDTSPANKKTKSLSSIDLIDFTDSARLDIYDEGYWLFR